MTTHAYATTVRWSGSTGLGYRAYPRAHSVTAGGATLTLARLAHEDCYIAHSLSSTVELEVTVVGP